MDSSTDNFAPKHLILLLQLIKAGADVRALRERGLHYSQIAGMIALSGRNGWIEDSGSGLVISEAGTREIENYANKNKIRGKDQWISAQDQFRVDKLPIYAVYLPRLKTIRVDLVESLAQRGKPRE